jgi:AraC-like DNA-binding protein/predicted transcriptional regulator YdeE
VIKLETNLQSIQQSVNFIEAHLSDSLDLERVAQVAGYSKYHLHRMFSAVVGTSVYNYILRRRLTEAARRLIFTNDSIIDIALSSGYESQQSFSVAFQKLFRRSPQAFRKKREFYPFLLRFHVEAATPVPEDANWDVRIVEGKPLVLMGFTANTKKGFAVIGTCWRQMHAAKQKLSHRVDPAFHIGLNDYSNGECADCDQPSFDYYAAAEVSAEQQLLRNMRRRELPASRYAVLCFRANPKASIQSVSEYLYRVWFPQTSFRFNENAQFDFVKYGETLDANGTAQIEYWIPIL